MLSNGGVSPGDTDEMAKRRIVSRTLYGTNTGIPSGTLTTGSPRESAAIESAVLRRQGCLCPLSELLLWGPKRIWFQCVVATPANI